MPEPYLYQEISVAIRGDILQGKLKPGDRLPSLREMAAKWGCTLGTVQRAYKDLAEQGLIVSRAGQGTRVVEEPIDPNQLPLRRMSLIHRAEDFLLEVMTAGYSPEEVDLAFRMALDRWRVVTQEPEPPDECTLRFVGSHDLVITWMAAHFEEILPGYNLRVRFTGSLGGLMALAQGEAEIAGSHLWDEKSDTYNTPFVRRLFPGKRVAVLTLFHRHLGLILSPGNPKGIKGLPDLTRSGVRFINRQSGSGTRVWLDVALDRIGIPSNQIQGFEDERITHSEVARAVAEEQADAGIGLEAAARAYGLDFLFLKDERYDLVIPAEKMDLRPVSALQNWLGRHEARRAVASLGGYRTEGMGELEWVEG
ncbi:MAG TPA: substrate-binding domain-containing protein [Anaerolineales bacterium]